MANEIVKIQDVVVKSHLSAVSEKLTIYIKSKFKALSDLIGTVPAKVGDVDTTTVVAYIDAKVAAANADNSALAERVTANEEAIDLLNDGADVSGSVLNMIKSAFQTFTTEMSDDKTVNTFKELLDYAATHQGEFTELITKIGELPADAGVDTIVAYVEKLAAAAQKEADDRIKVIEDDYLKAADKTELSQAITGLENGQVKTNKEAIEAINNETTGILKQSKDYADGLASNYDEAGAAAGVQGATTSTVKDVEDAINGFTTMSEDDLNAILAKIAG